MSNLKNNKSRDYEGYINEIFKNDVAGDDLKESLVMMFNRLKKEQQIATFMNYTNITTVPKSGSLIELKNERGIFRVEIVRSILMRMIYDTKYPSIDRKMSDSQMGGRKGKGCRNNIFIINGIIHDVMKAKNSKPALLQIYDYAQMFDSIYLKEAISDVFDNDFNDDMLPLVYKANQEIHMAVNTPCGLSERQKLENIVLQGDTFGSLLASVQVDTIGKHCQQSGYGYKYKDSLEISMLGLVDDIIGVTEAGFKAQQMNALINVKTAEKGLRFGPTKCKSMLTAKNPETVIDSELFVDYWKVGHAENLVTGEADLTEIFEGQIPIEKVTEQKYLGFVISSTGSNMANITAIKKKSIGITKDIFKRLESLNLQKYYFECALIFMNAMLRGSILYACETYYDLKESELRQIERIEENFMRQMFKTTRGCPIVQLYLEFSQYPARFEIMKIRLLFLKNILNEEEDSLILNFVKLQLKKSSRGDWISTCLKDLKSLNITETLEEIKSMSKNKFNNILKERIRKLAFNYLIEKQGTKGSDIEYNGLIMQDYLRPNDMGLTIDEQRTLFSIRNKMVNIPANFGKEQKCFCGDYEDMAHILHCTYLNKEEDDKNLIFEQIYSGSLTQQIEILRKFHKKFEERKIQMNEYEKEMSKQHEKEENSHHVIPNRDPLFSVRVW